MSFSQKCQDREIDREREKREKKREKEREKERERERERGRERERETASHIHTQKEIGGESGCTPVCLWGCVRERGEGEEDVCMGRG